MKKLLAILSLVFLSLSFVGCEKKTAPDRVVPAGQVFRMQIWAAREGEAIDALAREYISAVKIPGMLIDVVKFDNDIELQEALVDELAEGRGPDVVLTDGEWIAQNTGKLTPMETSEGFGLNEFGTAFVRIASELLIQESQIWGIPVAVDTLAIVYNEEHLIDKLDSRNQPGRTWLEFRRDTEQLTIPDKSFTRFSRSGAAIGRTDNITHGVEILENLMMQFGTKFFTEDETAAGFGTTFGTTPEGKRKNFGLEALNFFTSFADSTYLNFSWNEHLSSPKDTNQDFTPFVNGDVSIVFAYPGDIAKIKLLISERGKLSSSTINERNMHVAMLPQSTDPDSSASRVVLGNLLAGAVPHTTKYPEQSWRFLKFLSKKDAQAGFHTATKMPTARMDLITEQAAEPDMGVFVRQAKFARSNLIPANKNDLREGLSEVVQAINTRGANAGELLRALEEKFTKQRQIELKRERLIQRATAKKPE